MPVDEITQHHLWKLVKSESDQTFGFNYHLQEIQETDKGVKIHCGDENSDVQTAETTSKWLGLLDKLVSRRFPR